MKFRVAVDMRFPNNVEIIEDGLWAVACERLSRRGRGDLQVLHEIEAPNFEAAMAATQAWILEQQARAGKAGKLTFVRGEMNQVQRDKAFENKSRRLVN